MFRHQDWHAQSRKTIQNTKWLQSACYPYWKKQRNWNKFVKLIRMALPWTFSFPDWGAAANGVWRDQIVYSCAMIKFQEKGQYLDSSRMTCFEWTSCELGSSNKFTPRHLRVHVFLAPQLVTWRGTHLNAGVVSENRRLPMGNFLPLSLSMLDSNP